MLITKKQIYNIIIVYQKDKYDKTKIIYYNVEYYK